MPMRENGEKRGERTECIERSSSQLFTIQWKDACPACLPAARGTVASGRRRLLRQRREVRSVLPLQLDPLRSGSLFPENVENYTLHRVIDAPHPPCWCFTGWRERLLLSPLLFAYSSSPHPKLAVCDVPRKRSNDQMDLSTICAGNFFFCWF